MKKPVLIEMKGKDIIEAISDMLPKNANPTPIGKQRDIDITLVYSLIPTQLIG